MSRPLRIIFPGAIYHLTSRGNAQAVIYADDTDRRAFLDLLTQIVQRHHWLCHTYCLMDNHYHLLIETPEGDLSQGPGSSMESIRSRPTGVKVGWGMCCKGGTKPFWLKRTVTCWRYAATWYLIQSAPGWFGLLGSTAGVAIAPRPG
jgi:REP element-mobilizing transposase RayT